MKQMLKRFAALALALILVFTAVPCAYAARLDTEGRKIRYGTIRVLGIGADAADMFRAARDDENGIVYIHAEDFAGIVGGTLSKSGREDDWSYNYSISSWKVHVSTKKGTANVFYDFSLGTSDAIGTMLHDEFQLTDCLYDELNGEWYFPFEEMLYMMALEWGCQNGTVFIYQPETIFDIFLDQSDMLGIPPDYADLMGQDGRDRWSDSWKYGWSAAIDELDMSFLWYGIVSPWYDMAGTPLYSDYEKETMIAAMMLMQSDQAAQSADPVVGGMEWVSDFIAAAATCVDLSSTETGFPVARELLFDMLGLVAIPSQLETLSAEANFAAPVMGYLLDAAQTIWVREQVSADLDDRLEYLETAAESRAEGNPFWMLLSEQAAEARNRYCGEISGAFGSISPDAIAGMLDGLLQLDQGPDWKKALTGDIAGILQDIAPDSAGAAIGAAGSYAGAGLTILSWMNLAVGTIDLCVEVAKDNSPTFAKALEAGENAHLCRYLIHIVDMLQEESSSAFWNATHGDALTQQELDALRTSTHLLMVASLHSHDLLNKLGKYTLPNNTFMETSYIVRLLESSKYDQLLLMDENFSDIVSYEEGCLRHDIPVEYVRIIEPVIVTTETRTEESEHFYANVTRPHVYAEANPNLTAAVNAVLDPLYSDIQDRIEEEKNYAANCTMDRGDHYISVKLVNANSNGGFLVLSLGIGAFNCDFGHNTYSVNTYLFDIASGSLLGLEDLFDTEKNPDALSDLFAAMEQDMLESGGWHAAADDGPSDVTAETIYDEARKGYSVDWELNPTGLLFSIRPVSLNIALVSVSVSYEELKGILKEEYLPPEVHGTASLEMAAFDETLLNQEFVYENTPADNVLIVSGQSTNLWVDNVYNNTVPEKPTGDCAFFYAFGLQNCVVTLPNPIYPELGYRITWQDDDGDHIETFAAP